MSFLDSIRNIKKVFSSRNEEENFSLPYKIQTRLNPYRLKARTGDSIELFIAVKNLQHEKKLTSVTIKCAGDIGFSETTLKKNKRIHLGMMKPNEEKILNVRIYGSSVTKKGEYPIAIIVTSHFRDYEHIENAVRKKIAVRAV
ncbi:hypothetical protein J7J26_00970 [Candidatus Micrarchaeota archaeon]|nr:hypothetical protein [Candidatus Micrarchaeota archaeon]